MSLLLRLAGLLLISVAFVDVYLTVLYPRTGMSILSLPLSKGIWFLFRRLSRIHAQRGSLILSFCGPLVLVAVVFLWLTLLIVGLALFIWPDLGTGIQASEGKTPTDFVTALYYSGFNFTTLGVGDFTPKTVFHKLLTIVEAALGFAIFTVSITYLLSVYDAIIKRNTFALSLHHRMAGKPSALRLLIGLKSNGRFESAYQEISGISQNLLYLLEAHHSYPILHYFRFQNTYYSLPRMVFIALDLVALVKSALDPQVYDGFINSAAIAELESGSTFMLHQINRCLVEETAGRYESTSEDQWREKYYRAARALRRAGILTVLDDRQGAQTYVNMRQQWQAEIADLAKYMDYRWLDIAPCERDLPAARGLARHDRAAIASRHIH